MSAKIENWQNIKDLAALCIRRFNACYCVGRVDALYNELFIKCRDAAEGNNGLYRKEKRRGGSSHKS
jgi:hypothetical protein